MSTQSGDEISSCIQKYQQRLWNHANDLPTELLTCSYLNQHKPLAAYLTKISTNELSLGENSQWLKRRPVNLEILGLHVFIGSGNEATYKKIHYFAGYVEHRLEHYKQKYNWDCGVSCVIMLLSEDQRVEMLDNFDQICQEEGFNQSTWTIDLCYLLKRFGIQHVMYTTLLGVNESYRKKGYYNKIIKMDRERVLQRFEAAVSSGIEVQEHSLTAEELVAHLRNHGPVVVLVDSGLLVCDLCKHNKMKAEFRRCFGGSYSGHYVVVVGYSGGRLLYRDPALLTRLCAASPARLQRASVAPGTDHDVILVYNDYR